VGEDAAVTTPSRRPHAKAGRKRDRSVWEDGGNRIHRECVGRVEIDGGDRLPACTQRSAEIGVQSDPNLLIGRQRKICRNDYGTCDPLTEPSVPAAQPGTPGIGLACKTLRAAPET